MARSIRSRVWDVLESRRNGMWIVAAVACLAAVLSVVIAVRLSQVAVTLTRNELVLACPYHGRGAHTHDKSCYDDDGNLVCPLEERELHTHDASCYDEDGELICGEEEVTDTHVHGAGCFVDADSVPMPRQLFTGSAGNIIVSVEAPDGAFPEGTTMIVEAVDGQTVHGAVESMLPENTELAAVDITFENALGKKIQPRIPVKVTMTSLTSPTKAKPLVLHLDDEGAADLVMQDAPNSLNTVTFEADSFSVYVMAVKRLQQTLTASDGRTYEISVTYTEAAGIPDDAELVVREINETDSSFASVFGRAKDAATSAREDATVTSARFFDISLKKDGVTLEPNAPVEVNIVLKSGIGLSDDTSVVHFVNSRKVEVVESEAAPIDEKSDVGVDVTFTTDSFSVFGIMEITLEKRVLASDGQMYHISVAYSSDAGVPAGAELKVDEIVKPEGAEGDEASAYQSYVAQVADAFGWDAGSIPYARLFDIRIVDRAGNKVELSAPVSVQIELEDYTLTADEDTTAQVMHFVDDADSPDVVSGVAVDGDTVSFKADGFSVYAIVQAPPPAGPAEYEPETVTSSDELETVLDEAFFLSVVRNDKVRYYFTNYLNGNGALYVEKSPTATTATDHGAAEWFLVKVQESGAYLLKTIVDNQELYLCNTTKNEVGLVANASDATPFILSEAGGDTFYFKHATKGLWLQYSNTGRGIRLWSDANDDYNPKITIDLASSYQIDNDPYGLDGKTYGIAYHNDTAKSTSLGLGEGSGLASIDMIMREDTVGGTGLMLVAEGRDITEWTFECVDYEKYRIYTMVDEVPKYLTINGNNVTLSEDADATGTIIKVVPGTGEYAGKYSLSVGSYALNLPGSDTGGFNATNNKDAATKWMNLVTKSNLTEDDFRLYTFKKASVSDTESVTDGTEVVLYTRVWNEAIARYEFYVVDYDGTLQRCYDVGDAIEWIGNRRNSARWVFTEHRESGAPNYYYELRNAEYGDYIAPLLKDSQGNPQIVSSSPPGINLNGRRYGYDYTTIIAWDDHNYEYVGLKVENGKLVPCPLSEADDFYFALVPEHSDDGGLTEVKTIDGSLYGIEMKMINFPNNYVNGRARVQLDWFGGDGGPGLLSTNLDENGYPTGTNQTNKNGVPLSDLFDNMQDVNHLFIQSVYNESGYFEYDSTQNFAHLNEEGEKEGTFTVYDQIGAITGKNETKVTRTHGQFMPYNDIEAGSFAFDKTGKPITNLTDVLKNPLPDTNPRKGEKLYLIGDEDTKTADYFFGMEMSASFTQTASGLDAWGHDIIFEFSGDDDFWFYVDDELVLDLGGVHQAEAGTINFRTGEVWFSRVVSPTSDKMVETNTTLYQVFRDNYVAREMSEEDIESNLARIFTQNSAGQYVFKDYTNHKMRMFYMERGAGASNLHMRFNLAAVRPGTFLLSKKLSGAESESNSLVEFPYQVFYYVEGDGEHTAHQLTDASKVVYEGTSKSVKYAGSFTPAGGTKSYENVFFLKPGETAEVELPEHTVSYYVVECGVNPEIYNVVSANGEEITGEESRNPGRLDYPIEADTLNNRSSVEYDNHVSQNAVRTLNITKRLWDQGGQNRLEYPDDKTPFTLRLYLGSENDSSEDLPLANMYPYHVKVSKTGEYCRWDADAGTFASLGKTDFAELTEEERASATFTTSIYGSISYIPADHTVEVRNLIAGTQFMVEERANEIPRGYTLRQLDGYTRVDIDPSDTTFDEPYAGTITAGETPSIEVRNQKGWGLTVEKDWTDRDFMSSREPAYFGVFLDGTLVNGSVRQLAYGQKQIYYFFESLAENKKFSDYVIREVEVTPKEGLTVDDIGVVSGYTSADPIDEGGAITINGIATGDTASQSHTYHVHYEVGEATLHNENVRTDTVTNSRPGIELVKTRTDGETPLSGAVFTLKNASGQDVSAATYTSGSDGRITVAYLAAGTYTLTEVSVPKGFVALPAPVTIEVRGDGTVEVSGGGQGLVDVQNYTEEDAEMLATITVKNRQGSFQIVKIDGDLQTPLKGVAFALYKQVTDAQTGELIPDYYPVPGFENIVTDINGILQGIDGHLPPRTYYLREKTTLPEYDLLTKDLCFTMGEDGTVTINNQDPTSWRIQTNSDSESGEVSYLIEVLNSKQKLVSFKKVDIDNISGSALQGAEFDLYHLVGEERQFVASFVSDSNGMLVSDGWDSIRLAAGTYHLIETKAPEGYILKTDPVVITVNADGVTYNEHTALSSNGRGVNEQNGVYLLLISNSQGFELPSTGSSETIVRAFIGVVMLLGGAVVLFLHRRKFVDER